MSIQINNLGNHNHNAKNCNNIGPVIDTNMPDIDAGCGVPSDIPCDEGRRRIWGSQGNCDPMQSGAIVNDPANPDRNIIHRYPGGLRGADMAMQDLFKGLVVIDDDGKVFPVPLFPGTQEKAVAWLVQENARKDDSSQVDRPVLPFAAIHASGISPDDERFIYHRAKLTPYGYDHKPLSYQELKEKDIAYSLAPGKPVNITYTLYLWTRYIEDMNQLLEQVLLKFSPTAYIKVHGVPWEIPVKLDSLSNNIDTEIGDQNERVVKYQIEMTAVSYIPQPIRRDKTVLKITTDYFNSVDENQMHTVFARRETT